MENVHRPYVDQSRNFDDGGSRDGWETRGKGEGERGVDRLGKLKW